MFGLAHKTTGRRKDRPLEWYLSGLGLAWGSALLFGWPGAPDAESPQIVGALSIMLGAAHMAALMLNGSIWWTPIARLVITSGTAGLYAWIAAGLASAVGVGAAGVPIYWAFGFLWCAYVAGRDVARMRLGTYGL